MLCLRPSAQHTHLAIPGGSLLIASLLSLSLAQGCTPQPGAARVPTSDRAPERTVPLALEAPSAPPPEVMATPADPGERSRAPGTAPAPEPMLATESEVASAPQAVVILERPYRRYARPRAEGAVLAAGEDETLARWNVGGNSDPDHVSNRAGYHPGARVVVETKLVAGTLPARSSRSLSQQSLLAQSRSRGYWPLRVCYEDALRRDPEQAGKTRLRLSIARSGRVTRARLQATELDRAAGECLRQAVEALHYRPAPPALVAVDLSVEFWPGDAPVLEHESPPGVTPSPGVLDADAVERVVSDALGDIRQCYRQGRARDEKLWGRLELVCMQRADGTLVKVDENQSHFPDRQVTQCIVERMTRLDFPPPAGGAVDFIIAFRLGAPTAESADESAQVSATAR